MAEIAANLRGYRRGLGKIVLDDDPTAHKLRVSLGAATYGVVLVEVTDASASPVRVKVLEGIKALKNGSVEPASFAQLWFDEFGADEPASFAQLWSDEFGGDEPPSFNEIWNDPFTW